MPANLPRVERFFGSIGTAASNGWVPWTRPKYASMHMFICIGGGSSGGGGWTGATATGRGGGAGGSSGAVATLTIPAFFLPRTLYLFPGWGGAGVAAATAGNAGGSSVISDKVNTYGIAANHILISDSAPPAGGAAGNGTTVSNASSGGSAATNDQGIYQGLGLWFAAKGTVGGKGSNVTTGIGLIGEEGNTDISFTNTNPCILTGGTGGGGAATDNTSGVGGPLTGQGYPPIPSAASSGGAGTSGWKGTNPWRVTGGTGGGGHGAGTGGVGGNGGPGCGGGGGGGGITGGRSGDGGPGLIIIMSW